MCIRDSYSTCPTNEYRFHPRLGRLKGALTGGAAMRFLDDRGGFGAAGTRTGSWKAPGGGIAAGLAYSSASELVWPRGVEGDAMLEAG